MRVLAPAYIAREHVTPRYIRALTYCVSCAHSKVAELSGVEAGALSAVVSYELGAWREGAPDSWEFEATPSPYSMSCAVCRVQLVTND